MTSVSPPPSPASNPASVRPCRPLSESARPSRLLAGIYHDIGMAAVAASLELAVDALEPEAHEAVKRGHRYIYLMPRRQEGSQAAA